MQWLLCAVTGKLPGQAGRSIQFATAPGQLEEKEWLNPSSYPCDDGHSCENRYTVGDVFFAEACMLQQMCRNRAELFRIRPGVTFQCDFDEDGFVDFTRDMLRMELNLNTGFGKNWF